MKQHRHDMRFTSSIILLLCLTAFDAQARWPSSDRVAAENSEIVVQPVRHGTLVLTWNGTTVYVDPVGGGESFVAFKPPDMILITHLHGDHLSVETLKDLDTENAVLIVPQSVADELPAAYREQLRILANGEETRVNNIPVRAVPMYNLPDDETARHPSGWGNGYVLNLGGKRVYVSGDTEGTREMRSLENIDIAFVCMNLPYTMDVEQAADAVLDFKPVVVYPYHHRGQDIEEFKRRVNAGNVQIDVRLLNWYP